MTFKQFKRIVEIRTKIISMATFISGSLFAAVTTGSWSWIRFCIMGMAVLLVDMGTTGFNSYFDYINGTDNQTYNLEKDKVLVHEGVQPSVALFLSLSLFGLAGILGLVLAFLTSWWILVVGGICLIVGYTYTGGPWPISRTPFGELFAGGFLGTVLFVLSYYVQELSFDITTVLASIPFFFLIAMILSVNNACDMEADYIAGRRTLSLILGERWAIRLMAFEGLIAYTFAVLLIFWGIYPSLMLPVVIFSIAISVREYIMMRYMGFSLETKGSSMEGISMIFLVFSFSLILGCLASLIF
jgi:1,4-dihydroxy-2-naphthoate polyprenyltransferase